MTRRIGWRLILAVLAVCAAAFPAWAADAPPVAEGAAASPPAAAEKCPDIYGVWETEYAVGRFGVEEVGPWFGDLLLKATIGREKTTLVWLKSDDFPNAYTSSVFRRDTSFKQRDVTFFGHNAGGNQVLASVIDEYLIELYPGHPCMLSIAVDYKHSDGKMVTGQRVLMRKVK